MFLTNATVQNFRSIDQSGDVAIDSNVTVLVGQNESGKTAFLQALDKYNSVGTKKTFNVTEDFPRKNLSTYQKQHGSNPEKVVFLAYTLEADEVESLNKNFGLELKGVQFFPKPPIR